MMIYCKAKEIKDNSAIYLFGNDIEDITGEAEFFSTFTEPQILKQPKTGSVPSGLLAKVVIKYKEQLTKGNFPEKMSFER